ncbi:acyltransferase family protein [Mangrovimicrobium sediminis]|uniref:Acyltransferase family protein n=1 Tax=Mangrovimicrobium sediminis TaxID=2562682 RepID=A0A4Z0M0T7_9GAMM|nr:lysophospholipid acyltransferase family protein [Haliea sp. SAOS-164]TGD72988.1 acyltransferase family protein [Haliea sp. SAOS-164]
MAGLLDKDNQPLSGDRLAQHIETALAIEPAATRTGSLGYQVLKKLFRPVVFGAENLPASPALYIGNHSLFALDTLVLWPLMQAELNIFARPMADKLFFNAGPVGDALLKRGLVMGHPAVCEALMREGQDILLYPGGAHEAVKPERDRYQLLWKERYGFIRLAAKHGYTIVPVAMVGPDEFYDYLYDGEELPDTKLGSLLRRLGVLTDNTRPDLLPPLPMGALSSLFPKLQRCLVSFGKPLDLSRYKGRVPAKAQQKKLRQQVADEIESEIARLLVERERLQHQDGLLRRIFRA